MTDDFVEADEFEDEEPILTPELADGDEIPEDGIPTPIPPPSPKNDEVPLTDG